MDQIRAAVRAQKQACQKTTKADPDPGQVGPFVDPPIPDNDSHLCNELRPRAEYLRASLAKLYGNKDFDARFNVNNEVRKRADRSANSAHNARVRLEVRAGARCLLIVLRVPHVASCIRQSA